LKRQTSLNSRKTTRATTKETTRENNQSNKKSNNRSNNQARYAQDLRSFRAGGLLHSLVISRQSRKVTRGKPKENHWKTQGKPK